MRGEEGLWSITFSGVERHFRTVTVKARSATEATRIARQLAADEVEANEHDGEDAGEWCDGAGVDAKTIRTERSAERAESPCAPHHKEDGP